MNHSLSTTLLHSTDHHQQQQQQQSISQWSNLSNATSSPFTPPERNISLVSIEIAVQCLIFLVAVIGNMRVAVLLHRSRTVGTGPTRAARNDSERESVVKIERGPVEEEKKTKRRKMTRLSRMNYMMAHLTAADLFVAFFNVLPQLLWDITGKFQGNDVICRSVTHLQLVAMYASSYVLVATGLDRHSAICRPFNSITWSARRSKILVSAAWLLAFIFALPQVFIFSYRWDSRGSLNCWAVFQPPWTMRVYVVWVALSIYAIPVAILLVTYTLLCRAVWTSFQTGVDPGRRAERKKFSLTSLTSSFRSNSTKTSSLLRGRRPFLKNHFRSRTVEQLEKIERANGLEMEVLIPLGNQEIKKRQQQQQQQQHQQQQAPPFIASVVTFKLPEKSLESDRRLSGHFHRNAKVPTAGSSGFFGRNSKLKIRSETFTASPNVKSDIDEDLPQTALKQNGKTKSEEEAVKGVLDAGLPDQTKRGFTAVSKKKSQMSRAKIRTVKLTVIINISYLLCWCPFFFSQLWAALDAEAPYESPGMTITTLLASLNSCVNPLIFIFFVHIQRDKKGRVK